jgi:hypothetical protein
MFLVALAACSDYGAADPASTTNDAGVEAPADGSADGSADATPSAPFCAQKTSSFFCDGFDHGGAVGFDWTEVATQSGGVIDYVGAQSVSPPKSLLSDSSQLSGEYGWAYLRKVTGANRARIVLSFALRIEENGANYAHIAGSLVRAMSPHEINLRVLPTGSLVLEEVLAATQRETYPLTNLRSRRRGRASRSR